MKCSASCCLWNENVTYSRDTKLPSLEGRILAIKHFLIVRLFSSFYIVILAFGEESFCFDMFYSF